MLDETVEIVHGTVEAVWSLTEVTEESRRVVVIEGDG